MAIVACSWLFRLVPLLFATIFATAAAVGSVAVLYAAVLLHVLIIAAENTIGRLLAHEPVLPSPPASIHLDEIRLATWPLFHLSAFAATVYLILWVDPSPRQAFAVAAIFAYSITVFSASAAHELMHRRRPFARISGEALFALMLYPHFPRVHIACHHRWAGTDRDCQTPKPGQEIYGYLSRALVGGLRIATAGRPIAPDPYLQLRVLTAALAIATTLAAGTWALLIFLIVQGAFGFILVETINYIQHYTAVEPLPRDRKSARQLPNQDLNFVSRSMLFNLPLHAAHHADTHSHWSTLSPLSGAPTCSWGYWTSFWLAWMPPLWSFLYAQEHRR